VAQQCKLTMEEQIELAQEVGNGFEDLSDDASTMEILEMVAEVLNEPFENVHNRFMDVKEGRL